MTDDTAGRERRTAARSLTISLDLARLVKFDPKQLHRTGLFDEAVALQDAIRAAAESAGAGEGREGK